MPSNEKKKKKKSGVFLKCILVLIIIQAIVYTWAHLWLSYQKGYEISPTVSVAFYTFCAGEASLSALIKIKKKNDDGGNNIE